MKYCPYCHKEVRLNDTICPHCGLHIPKQEFTETDDSTKTNELQGTLFDHPLEEPALTKQADEQSELATEPPGASLDEKQGGQDETDTSLNSDLEKDVSATASENRADKEFRMKNNEAPYLSWLKRVTNFLAFYREKLIRPTDTFKRRRTIHGSYGYISYSIAALLAAFVFTRLIEALNTKYALLSQISVLPSVTTSPNYIFIYLKSVLFFLCFYFGFPIISFFIKKIFLKRQHVFHYWMTQYAGMNASGFLILLITVLLSIIAPFALLVVIIFGMLVHASSFVITFIAALYRSMNETKIDTIYLALMGLSLQFFILLSLLSIFI